LGPRLLLEVLLPDVLLPCDDLLAVLPRLLLSCAEPLALLPRLLPCDELLALLPRLLSRAEPELPPRLLLPCDEDAPCWLLPYVELPCWELPAYEPWRLPDCSL
jgi:hypothetical protein